MRALPHFNAPTRAATLERMSDMVRCPACDSFVKPASIEAGACPFCPTAASARRRDAIPGVVLAAAIAGAGCSGGGAREMPAPVYGGAPEVIEVSDAGAGGSSTDVAPSDAPAGSSANDGEPEPPEPPPVPVYGIAPPK